jgi:toxin FitB
MIVLDTSVLSEIMRLAPNGNVIRWLDQQDWPSLWTTSVTVFEIRTGVGILAQGRRRTDLSRSFDELLSGMNRQVLPFDTEAAELAGTLTVSRSNRGRPRELRDTMIAGIVLAHRAAMATRNVRDFDDIGAAVVDPWNAG